MKKMEQTFPLKGAGNDNCMNAMLMSAVISKIGKTETKWRFKIASITDSVIIGLDLLHHSTP